jgi:hypothetical protein
MMMVVCLRRDLGHAWPKVKSGTFPVVGLQPRHNHIGEKDDQLTLPSASLALGPPTPA